MEQLRRQRPVREVQLLPIRIDVGNLRGMYARFLAVLEVATTAWYEMHGKSCVQRHSYTVALPHTGSTTWCMRRQRLLPRALCAHQLALEDQCWFRSVCGCRAPEHEPAGDLIDERDTGSVAAGLLGQRHQVAAADRQ